MKKQPFNAVALKKLLIGVMLLTIAGAGVGFYFGLQQIREYAIEVNRTSEDAEASGAQIEQLRQLQSTLAQAEVSVQKANNLYATEANYQTQSLSAIQRYAAEAGISVTNTDFPTSAEADPNAPPSADRQVVITLGQPVSYERLTRFLQLIEGSLPKMQPASLKISRPDAPAGDAVTVDPITLNVSVR